jgi:methylated-DNA-protein-cysteine methyltransferase-like protein
VIRKIPRGRVLTYGDVAGLAGRPTSARRVGYALFAVRDPEVPWWRVVNARGEISLRHHSGPGGPEDEQRFRLLQEGVVFSADGRIDLSVYRHAPGRRPRRTASKKR